MKIIICNEKVNVKEATIMIDNQDLYGVYTWEETKNQVKLLNSLSYKGYSSWRLPIIEEFRGIYHKIEFFENLFGKEDKTYWSDTECDHDTWVKTFNKDIELEAKKEDYKYVRLIRDV